MEVFQNQEYRVRLHFTGKISSLIKLKSLKIYFRGGNLLTLSKIKDLDPENLDAGITNFPLYRTLTGGVSITF